jgi:hypothetical protein
VGGAVSTSSVEAVQWLDALRANARSVDNKTLANKCKDVIELLTALSEVAPDGHLERATGCYFCGGRVDDNQIRVIPPNRISTHLRYRQAHIVCFKDASNDDVIRFANDETP